ncbi:hypothetical protein PGT21_020841 [Puccinia graminis f. sp. tritici]|uniref:Uncharacterized protein n=1 Tax=Puccinia graminis f. sp. tritici TaxID=56615 RepID=A0A5B0QBD9_PUCGR|nr:hypothetical protein PGT21_020841 [Puccinia graminis f. sp. tritici]
MATKTLAEDLLADAIINRAAGDFLLQTEAPNATAPEDALADPTPGASRDLNQPPTREAPDRATMTAASDIGTEAIGDPSSRGARRLWTHHFGPPTAGTATSRSQIRILYDPWIFDETLRLVNPGVVRGDADYYPNPLFYMDICARPIAYDVFKKKVFKLIGSVPAAHDVVGLIKLGETLGHLKWVGRISDARRSSSGDFYDFPAKYTAFRRRLLNSRILLRGEVRIKYTESYQEQMARAACAHDTDEEVTDDDQQVAEVSFDTRVPGRPMLTSLGCPQALRATDSDSEVEGPDEYGLIGAVLPTTFGGLSEEERPAKRTREHEAGANVIMDQ